MRTSTSSIMLVTHSRPFIQSYIASSLKLGLRLTAILLSFLLISCGGSNHTVFPNQDGPPTRTIDVSKVPNAVPQPTQRSKYGNPASYEVFGKRYYVMPSSQGYKERGVASWYGSKFHGKRTSSGEPYDMHGMTAAHKTLPLPTYVKVTNLKNSRVVVLKVNDRGPFHDNRIIDLSHTAATKLGIKATGTGLVEVEAINPEHWNGATLSSTQHNTAPIATTSPQENALATANLYLQLGAFVSSDNAYNLKNRVNSTIQPNLASVSTALMNSQQYYRVRIGPINTVEYADELSHTLNQKGFGQARIVID